MDNLSKFKSLPIYSDIIYHRAMHSIMLINSDQDILDDFSRYICLTMFCESNTQKPCQHCTACQKILHNNCVDILEYPRQENTIKRADLEDIVSNIMQSPYESNIKIYILRNVSYMDRTMQNKLLVSLEEPPANVYFILQVTNQSQIIPTIQSRCRKIHLPNYNIIELRQILGDEPHVQDAITFCNGSLANAKRFLANAQFPAYVRLVFQILQQYRKSTDTLIYASQLYDCKDDFLDILNIYERILQDTNYLRLGLQDLLHAQQYITQIASIVRDFSVDAICAMIQRTTILKEKIDRNCNYSALIDSFLLGILEVRHFCPNKSQ